MSLTSHKSGLGSLVLCTALLLPWTPLSAATSTWNLDADGNWDVNSNWSGSGYPNGNSDDAVLGNIITADRTITLGSSVTVRSILFNDNNAYTLTGNQLSLKLKGDSLIQSGSGAVNINSDVHIKNDTTFNGNGTGIVTVNGVISEDSGSTDTLTKDGSFTMVLNNNNTFTGGLTVNAGTVEFGADGANGTGALTLNGGTIQAGGGARTINEAVTLGGNFTIGGANDLTLSGNATLTGNQTITVNNTASSAFSGVISGGFGITKDGNGQLVLSGTSANTFTGATTVNSGTLELAKGGALGSTSSVTLNSGGTLLFSGSSTDRINNSAGITLNGGTINANNATETMGTLTLAANSVINLATGGGSGSLTFANGTYSGGTLTINNWAGTGSGGTDDRIFFTSNPGATFLSEIQFTGFSKGAVRLGSGEIVPVPEARTIFCGILLIGLLTHKFRRRSEISKS